MVATLVRVRSLLRQGQYSLIHVNPSLDFVSLIRDGSFLILAKMYRVPSLVLLHGWLPEVEEKLKRYFLPLFRWLFFSAKVFVVLGFEFEQKLRSMGFTGLVFRLFPPVDDKLLTDVGEEEIRLRHMGRRNPVVLFLARIEEQKGIFTLIKAFEQLQETLPSAELLIAGAGPDEAEMRSRLEHSKTLNYSLIGHVEGKEKISVFKRSSVYVLPSVLEGLPLSVLEGMALGLPIITRPVGGLKDFFQVDKMGYLMNGVDPAELAGLLHQCLRKTEALVEMGIFNYRYARENFLASRIAESLEDIYGQYVI